MDERDQPTGESAQPKRTPVTRQNYQSLIDQRFAEAAAAGLFDNLPGQGQPQQLDDDALVTEEDRAAFRLLKAAASRRPGPKCAARSTPSAPISTHGGRR